VEIPSALDLNGQFTGGGLSFLEFGVERVFDLTHHRFEGVRRGDQSHEVLLLLIIHECEFLVFVLKLVDVVGDDPGPVVAPAVAGGPLSKLSEFAGGVRR
jgi:hypothetical protein